VWVIGVGAGGPAERGHRLLVAFQLAERFAAEVERVRAGPGRVAEWFERVECVLGHAELEVSLGLPLELPAADAILSFQRITTWETIGVACLKRRHPVGRRRDVALSTSILS
jgi:hypothetical protein